MEDYEKFKLSLSNVFMLTLTLALLGVLILVSYMLYQSLQKPNDGLPTLNITQGRNTTESTTAGSATTTTTTTKKIRTESPYYELDVDNILKDEIFTKKQLSRDDALKVGEELFKVVFPLYNYADNSLFDIDATINGAKEGELDAITVKNVSYGELYNFEAFLEKVFSSSNRSSIYNLRYNKTNVFIKEDGHYYRMKSPVKSVNMVIADYNLVSLTSNNLNIQIRYYNSNYKELGYTAPNYKTMNLTATFEERWKVSSYDCPIYSAR